MALPVDCNDSSVASKSEGGSDSKEVQFVSARIIDIEKGGEGEGDGGVDAETMGHSEELQCVKVDTVEKGGKGDEGVDYERRGQWLRAATLGANDGLLTTASLMMGVGAVNSGAVVLSGMASLVAGASSMAIGEFVSVSTQRDIEASAAAEKRRRRHRQLPVDPASAQVFPAEAGDAGDEEERLPSAWLAAGASAASFAVGAAVPLLAAAFITAHVVRQAVLAATATAALAVFGAAGAHFGGASAARGCIRVVIGGWAAMLLSYGVLKAFSRFGHLSGSSG